MSDLDCNLVTYQLFIYETILFVVIIVINITMYHIYLLNLLIMMKFMKTIILFSNT